MVRCREVASGWQRDGAFNLYLFVDAPVLPKKKSQPTDTPGTR
jgi:hypothetical protein